MQFVIALQIVSV